MCNSVRWSVILLKQHVIPIHQWQIVTNKNGTYLLLHHNHQKPTQSKSSLNNFTKSKILYFLRVCLVTVWTSVQNPTIVFIFKILEHDSFYLASNDPFDKIFIIEIWKKMTTDINMTAKFNISFQFTDKSYKMALFVFYFYFWFLQFTIIIPGVCK